MCQYNIEYKEHTLYIPLQYVMDALTLQHRSLRFRSRLSPSSSAAVSSDHRLYVRYFRHILMITCVLQHRIFFSFQRRPHKTSTFVCRPHPRQYRSTNVSLLPPAPLPPFLVCPIFRNHIARKHVEERVCLTNFPLEPSCLASFISWARGTLASAWKVQKSSNSTAESASLITAHLPSCKSCYCYTQNFEENELLTFFMIVVVVPPATSLRCRLVFLRTFFFHFTYLADPSFLLQRGAKHYAATVIMSIWC